MFAQEPPALALAPGASVAGVAGLLDLAKFPAPGEYDVALEYEWDGGLGVARSQPVRLKLRPCAPTRARLDSIFGGRDASQHLLWVDSASGQGELVLSILRLFGRPRLDGSTSLGPIGLSAQPVIAVPANGADAPRRWIAWLERGGVRGLRLTDGAPDGKRLEFPELPAVPTTLLGALLNTSADGSEAAAVLCQRRENGHLNVQIGTIGDSGAFAAGPMLKIEGARLIWGGAFTLAGGEHRIHALTQSGADESPSLALHALGWASGSKEIKPVGLARFETHGLAAALALERDDSTRGALLTVDRPHLDDRAVLLRRWTQAPGGAMQWLDPIPIGVPAGPPIQEVRMTIGMLGEVFGLIRQAGEPWARFNHDANVAAPLVQAPPSPDGFVDIRLQARGRPALIYADPPRGFAFARFDGRPYDA
jgi:hypothetical protein